MHSIYHIRRFSFTFTTPNVPNAVIESKHAEFDKGRMENRHSLPF